MRLEHCHWLEYVNSDLLTRFLAFLIVSPLLISGIWVLTMETTMDKARGVADTSGRTKKETWLREMWIRAKARILLSVFIFVISFVFLVGSQYLPLFFAFGAAAIVFSLHLSNQEIRNLKKIRAQMEQEFPSVVQIMAVLTSAGMSPVRAIQAISESSETLIAHEFTLVIEEIRSGRSMIAALEAFASRIQTPTARRFAMSMAIALERGSPIATTLIEQARDITSGSKNRLQREAGKREVTLMIPVVFLIMPISVLFALWPSMNNLIAIA